MVVIQSTNSSLVLGATASAGKVTLQHYTGSSLQKWDIAGDTIKNHGNGEVLEVQGSGNSGTSVITYPYYKTPNQHWTFHSDGTIQSHLGGNLVLDVCSGSLKHGQEIIVYGKHGGANQLFKIVSK